MQHEKLAAHIKWWHYSRMPRGWKKKAEEEIMIESAKKETQLDKSISKMFEPSQTPFSLLFYYNINNFLLDNKSPLFSTSSEEEEENGWQKWKKERESFPGIEPRLFSILLSSFHLANVIAPILGCGCCCCCGLLSLLLAELNLVFNKALNALLILGSIAGACVAPVGKTVTVWGGSVMKGKFSGKPAAPLTWWWNQCDSTAIWNDVNFTFETSGKR